MPVLENQRHEIFCREVIKGKSDTQAYITAFQCDLKQADANAWRVKGNEGVQARITELLEKTENKLVLSIQEKREFLAKALRTPVGEVDETSVLAQSVKYTESKEGSSKEVKMIDKLTAIKLDSDLAGHFAVQSDKATVSNITIEGGQVVINQLSIAE